MLVFDRQSAAASQSRGGANRPGCVSHPGGASSPGATNPPCALGRVHLRLGAGGQLVELLPGKTTIGSSPRCNVRIQQPGVQPVHCLIVHGAEGLTVRSWARDTRLNGAAFVESSLGLGDCLSVGPVELEVVDPQAAVARPVGVAAADESKSPSGESQRASELSEVRKFARGRSRNLLDTLRRERTVQGELRQQVSELEQVVRHVAAERDAAGDKLAGALAELTATRQELAQQRAASEENGNQLAEQNRKLSGEVERLSARISELTHEHESADRERQKLLDETASLKEQNQQLLSENSRLQNDVRELSSQHAALAGECDELRKFNEQLSGSLSQLAEEKSAIASERGAVGSELDRLNRENDDLRCERDELSQRVERLEREIAQQNEERLAAESAWKSQCEEAAALGESNQQLANENTRLSAKLSEVAEQLTATRKEIAAGIGVSAELERERETRAHAEAALAEANSLAEGQLANQAAQFEASIRELEQRLEQQAAARVDSAIDATAAAAERKITEQSQRFEEAIRGLEQRLAEAEQSRELVDRVRSEAAIQQLAAEKQAAEQSRRVAELEAQLAAAEERAELAARAAIVAPSAPAWQSTTPVTAPTPPAQSNAFFADEVEASEPVATPAIDWSIRREGHESPEQVNEPTDTSAADLHDSQSEATSAAATWASSFGDAPGDERPVTSQQSRASNVEHEAEGLFSAKVEAAADAANPWSAASEFFSGQPSGENRAFEASEEAFGSNEAPAALSTVHDSMAQEAAAHQPMIHEPSVHESTSRESVLRESASNLSSAVEPEVAKKPDTTSFIERYAHMFTDEETGQEQKPAPAVQPNPAAAGISPKSRTMGIVRSEGQAAPPVEEEESIEQYMSKLLQRVRGDSAAPAPAAMPTVSSPEPFVPLNAPVLQPVALSPPFAAAPLPISTAESTEADGLEPVPQPEGISFVEAIMRKPATAAPTTDLGALRALANETARRAISRHELRKHRRNAVTKVIVSTLAGVTSLWLMLDSPDWKDTQFITACVSLLVAAIWAGETFRTMLLTFRIAANDRPEADRTDAAPVQPAALPIDVEQR